MDFIAFCEGVIATYKAAGKAGTANVYGGESSGPF